MAAFDRAGKGRPGIPRGSVIVLAALASWGVLAVLASAVLAVFGALSP